MGTGPCREHLGPDVATLAGGRASAIWAADQAALDSVEDVLIARAGALVDYQQRLVELARLLDAAAGIEDIALLQGRIDSLVAQTLVDRGTAARTGQLGAEPEEVLAGLEAAVAFPAAHTEPPQLDERD